MKRTFIHKNNGSEKFWIIDINGEEYTLISGQAGVTDHTKTICFNSEDECREDAEKLIAEKLKKGYQETKSEVRTGFSSLKEALEHSGQTLSLKIYCDEEAITPEITKLVNLRELQLSSFTSKTELPVELASLPNLKSLHISGSSNIILPDFIKAMPLEEFKSEIVSYGAVAAIKTLKKLNILVQEKFTTRVDHICQNLTGLTSLSIRGYAHGFENELPASIKNLVALEELIVDPKLARLPEEIAGLKNLRSLEIAVSEFPEGIVQLPNLNKLVIRAKVAIPETIKNLPLHTLHVRISDDSYDASLPVINRLTGLKNLNIETLRSLDDIASLTQLKSLSIRSCTATDWSKLSLFANLEYLDISNCKNIKPRNVAVFGKLKKLKSVIICSSALDSMKIYDLEPLFTLPELESLKSDYVKMMDNFEKRESLDYSRPEPQKTDTPDLSVLPEWNKIAASGNKADALTGHFSYLADTPGKEDELMAILAQIMAQCTGVSVSDEQLIITFDQEREIRATLPSTKINTSYPETYKNCLKVHTSVEYDECTLKLADTSIIDLGYEYSDFHEVGIPDLRKVVACILDYKKCWFYFPRKINNFGEPLLCFLDTSRGDIIEHQLNAGSAFIYRWAESFGIETTFNRFKSTI